MYTPIYSNAMLLQFGEGCKSGSRAQTPVQKGSSQSCPAGQERVQLAEGEAQGTSRLPTPQAVDLLSSAVP